MEIDVATLEERIKHILADTLSYAESDIKPTDRLVDDLGADSLDIVEIVMAIEDEFNIEIPEREASGMITVQELCEYVHKHIRRFY